MRGRLRRRICRQLSFAVGGRSHHGLCNINEAAGSISAPFCSPWNWTLAMSCEGAPGVNGRCAMQCAYACACVVRICGAKREFGISRFATKKTTGPAEIIIKLMIFLLQSAINRCLSIYRSKRHQDYHTNRVASFSIVSSYIVDDCR